MAPSYSFSSSYVEQKVPIEEIARILKTLIIFVFLIFCWLSFLPFFVKTGISALLILAYQHVVYDSKKDDWSQVFKNVLFILPTAVLYGLLGYLLVMSIPSIAFNAWWLYGSYLFYVLILENRLQSALIDWVVIPWQRPRDLKNKDCFTNKFNRSLGKYYKQIFALACQSLIKLAPIVFLPQVLAYFQVPLFFAPLIACVLFTFAFPKLDLSLGWTALMAIGLAVGMYIWPMPAIALWLKGLVITIMLSLIKVFTGSYLKDEAQKYWPECHKALGKNCFLFPLEKQKLEWVKFFTQKGADLTVTDDDGLTVLHHAANKGHLDVVKYLVEQGADHNAKVKTCGFLPIHFAAYNGCQDILKFLLTKHQGDISNIKSLTGENLLHKAAQGNQPEMIDFLVNDKSMEIDDVDVNGSSALHRAAYSSSLKAVKKLIDLGANKNLTNKEDKTPLQIAQEQGCNEIVNLLNGYNFTQLKLRCTG
ncbi:ankyrin repeat domain-containing protein [Gammaproteobacteria bacterium]|nr:ankyrin repeat domain-containing protein [Gammaproteobacteria bacterium]